MGNVGAKSEHEKMKSDKSKLIRQPGNTLSLVCVTLITLASLHCERSKDKASLVKRAEQSTIVVLQPGDERALGPYWSMSGKFLVFLPLAVRNENGQLEGKLAQRWEHSADYREWTYHIQRGIRWHDGVPVTAHDVKFTMDLWSHPKVLVVSPNYYKSVTVIDDYTLKVIFTNPNFGIDDWDTYYPKHLLEQLDPELFRNWEYWKQPIGNGPYRYVRHVPKTMIELEANPDYYRGKPEIERVILKFGGIRAPIELMSGNVDAVSMLSRVEIPKLARDPQFQIYYETSSSWVQAIYWNHRNPLFENRIVRRALTLAINRRELLQVLYMPENLTVSDVIFTHRQFQRSEVPAPLPFDPQESRRLFKQAGWFDTDGDGVLEREGKEFRFTAIVPGGGSEGDAMLQAAVYVQEQLRKLGIRMEIIAMNPGAIRARLRAGEFDAVFIRFFNQTNNHLKWFGESSPLGYDNPVVSELLLKARDAPNPDRKDAIYRNLMEIIRDDIPMTFLHTSVNIFVAHRRIRGLSSPIRSDTVRYMEYLWLEDQEKEPE